MTTPTVQGQSAPKDKIFRNFGGVNVSSPRQSIKDDEFYWLENIMPVGDGNLAPVYATNSGLQTIATGTVVYSVAVNVNSTDYIVAVMSNGNMWAILASSPWTKTQIDNGNTFSSSTRIAQWNNKGIVIIDPTAGYFDYNLTAPLTMSAISKAVATLTVTPGSGYTTQPTLTFTGGGATTQATAVCDLQAVSAVVTAAGANYVVGDILNLTGGTKTTTAQFRVATIGGGGAVATVTVLNAGDYTVLPANPAATTGGSGNGACTLTVTWGIGPATLTTSGVGYVSAPTVTVVGGGGGVGGAVVATVNGTMVGNCIATYAGRVWIGNGRTISFTDVASYNSFGGAGGSATISDQTLHNNITHLYAGNSYLYIFGDSSVDILWNVQVASGITSFTRDNISASIGTNLPLSVYSYFGSVVFANQTGFYVIEGTTIKKFSGQLDKLFYNIDFTFAVTGGQVFVNNILCAAFAFRVNDVFYTNTIRTIVALFFGGKWFFVSPSTNDTLSYIVSVPSSGVAQLFFWDAAVGLCRAFGLTSLLGGARIKSKLWDGDSPLSDKQVIRAGFGVIVGGTGSAMSMSIDNEFTTVSGLAVTPTINSYSFNASAVTIANGKFFGFTFSSPVIQSGITLTEFAIQYIDTRPW